MEFNFHVVRYFINYKISPLGIPSKIGQHYRHKVLKFWTEYSLVNHDGFLRDEDECRSFNHTKMLEDVKGGETTSVTKILIIVFGICLLVINLCAYVALFNQRRKLRDQEKLVQRLHAEVEVANNQENIPVSQSVRKGNKHEIGMPQNEGEHDAEGAVAGEGTTRDDCVQNGWKIPRQCSASTMNTHAKIRWWFERQQQNRPSSEVQLSHVESESQKCRTSQQRSEFHVEESTIQAGQSISHSVEVQNLSSPIVSKPNIRLTVPKKKVKKVSVAVDATPTARIASMFCKHVKNISGAVSDQIPETTLDLKNDSVKDRGNSALLNSSPPDIDSVLDKSHSPANTQDLLFPNNRLGGENCERENGVVPLTHSLMPTGTVVTDLSGKKNKQIRLRDESSEIANNNMDALLMTSSIKSELHIAKKDAGIIATPHPIEPEHLKSTAGGGGSDDDEQLKNYNYFEGNCGKNISVFPSLEHRIVKAYDKQTGCAQEAAVGARRLSLPAHIFWPTAKHRETTVRQGKIYTERRGYNTRCTRFSKHRRPSNASRKASNAAQLPPFKKEEPLQESIQPTNQILPTCKTSTEKEDHQLSLSCRPQDLQQSPSSVITPEEHSAGNQKELHWQLPSTNNRRAEIATQMSPPPDILIHKKPKSPAKVSVGTSTCSLILSEDTSTGMIRHVES